MPPRFATGQRKMVAIAAGLLIFGMVATATRIVRRYQAPGPFDSANQGLCDFHNGLYYPSRALLDGVSPYGASYAQSYPVARSIPFYSPSILLLHTPITVLPLAPAEWIYVVMSFGFVLAIGWFLASLLDQPTRWDRCLILSATVILSRGGHITLFNGYFTLELILATFIALHYADRRPLVAAIALAVVATKPTFILPLGFLMFARGNFKSLAWGAVISVVASVGPLVWLGYHEGNGDMAAGMSEIVAQAGQTQEIHRAEREESPIHSWTRIDLLALIAKWARWDPAEAVHLAAMMGLLVPPMAVLWIRRRRGEDDGLMGVTGAVILLSMLVSVYHQFYDALVLLAPIVGAVACRGDWQSLKPSYRLLLAAMMIVPLFNYGTSRSILDRLGATPHGEQVITSINAVVLTAAAVGVLWHGLMGRRAAGAIAAD